ncbi:MAG: oligosaccharide flippase family protein [Clostridia bacterium]|nr:oligosaccharide flippase family protein [Clostridia bacterium]
MAGIKKQSFLTGTAILVAANFLVKLIGAVFKIPLAHILEEEGMALFSSAYNFYAILFVIATAGLPVAVSKMVSESTAKNNEQEARKIFKASLILLTVIGLLGGCVLFFCSGLLAKSVGSENSALGIMAIAPAIFFVAVMSAFRGYFQGRSNMTPTAMSEVAEALGKLIIGLMLASLLLPTGLINSAAGAVLGVTAGSFLGCLTIFIIYIIDKKKIQSASLPITQPVRSMRTIMLRLAVIAIPITFGAAVSSLTNLIDLFIIRKRLGGIIVSSQMHNTLLEYFGLSASECVIGEVLSTKATEILYGAYSGFAVPMFNLPLTIVTALSMCLVPAISGAFALKSMNKVRRFTEISIRLTTLFALPCAAGLSLLSEPVLAVVYNNARAQSMLIVLGWAVIFVCLVSVTTAILQASGHVMIPVINMGIGAVVKIASGFVLLAAPNINIGGAPISTVLCYLTIALLNLWAIFKIIKPEFSILNNIIKPVIAVVLMMAAAYFTYQITGSMLGAPELNKTVTFLPQTAPVTPLASDAQLTVAISLFAAILVGAIVYFASIWLLKAVKKDDIATITKHE